MLQSNKRLQWPCELSYLGLKIIFMVHTLILIAVIAKNVLGLSVWRMYKGPVHAVHVSCASSAFLSVRQSQNMCYIVRKG